MATSVLQSKLWYCNTTLREAVSDTTKVSDTHSDSIDPPALLKHLVLLLNKSQRIARPVAPVRVHLRLNIEQHLMLRVRTLHEREELAQGGYPGMRNRQLMRYIPRH